LQIIHGPSLQKAPCGTHFQPQKEPNFGKTQKRKPTQPHENSSHTHKVRGVLYHITVSKKVVIFFFQ